MTERKRLRIRYSGVLGEPYLERPPRQDTREFAQWFNRIIDPRWRALCEFYNIDPEAADRHIALCEALALAHVPGFRPGVNAGVKMHRLAGVKMHHG